MIRWILPSVVGLLMCCIVVMQREISELQARPDPAAAIKQFERDFFARMQGAENLRKGAEAAQDAARRRNIDAGLSGLPTGNLRGPVYWGGKAPDVKDLSQPRE